MDKRDGEKKMERSVQNHGERKVKETENTNTRRKTMRKDIKETKADSRLVKSPTTPKIPR
jgi:hypothetical protein